MISDVKFVIFLGLNKDNEQTGQQFKQKSFKFDFLSLNLYIL